jgi:hypothetical protein
MRTTVEISESLLKRVRRVMKKRRVTLRALVEEGLERVVRDDSPAGGFRLRDARFGGETGFAPGAGPDDIARVLREMNEPRG